MYIVTKSQRVDPDEEYFPTGRMPLREKKVSTLLDAKRLADDHIARASSGIVIEVKDRNGRIKYRVEKDSTGEIKGTPLV